MPGTISNQGPTPHHKHFPSPLILLGLILILILALYTTVATMDKLSKKGALENGAYNTNKMNLNASAWQPYAETSGKFSVKYPNNWTFEEQQIENGKLVKFSPPTVTDASNQVKVFIMDNSYFGIEGLPTHSITVDDKEGIMIDEGLYGFIHNDKYITFDAGYDVSAKPYFATMIKSIDFK
jgi:hypothetical protein